MNRFQIGTYTLDIAIGPVLGQTQEPNIESKTNALLLGCNATKLKSSLYNILDYVFASHKGVLTQGPCCFFR